MNAKVFTVIIAEDEKMIANNIKNMICKCSNDFKVIAITYDGKEALKLASEKRPDLIITDIRMPEMDGLSLLTELNLQFPEMKKIIISGYAEFEYAKEAINIKVDDYLLKPVNQDELCEVLNRISVQYAIERRELLLQHNMNPRGTIEMVNQVREYVTSHYHEQIDFAKVSKMMGFSLSYITKEFGKHVGSSPTKYLRIYRLEIAKQMLSDQSYSIKQIAELVGFTDPFYFSRLFAKEYGLPPSRYRNELLRQLP